jgi:hypothetical protein
MADSVHYSLMEATQARFQALTLTGIDDASIIIAKKIDTRTLEKDRTAPFRMPGILICAGNTEKLQGGTNSRDDIGYPVAVYLFAKDDKDLTTNHDQYLRWREQLIGSVINQRFAGVPEQFRAEVEPGPIIHDGAWLKGLLASAFTIRFTVRRARGVI